MCQQVLQGVRIELNEAVATIAKYEVLIESNGLQNLFYLEANQSESEAEDDKSEAKDGKSEAKDGKSEAEDGKSEAEDGKSEAEDDKADDEQITEGKSDSDEELATNRIAKYYICIIIDANRSNHY